MNRIKLAAAATATFIAAALFNVPPAHAGQVGPSIYFGPLRSYYDGSMRVAVSGWFYNDGNVRATTFMHLVDTSNDGNNVYGHTDFWFYGPSSTDCGTPGTSCFYDKTRVSTGEINWRTGQIYKYLSKGLVDNASRVRGASQACAQMGWPVPDNCTPWAYPTINY